MGFLLDTLNHVVEIQVDANSDGATTGGRGGVQPDWQPVAGLETVACKVTFVRGRTTLAFEHPGATALHKVTFGQQVSLDIRNRLVWVDPDDGSTRYLMVDGRSWVDPTPITAALDPTWGCQALEYAL